MLPSVVCACVEDERWKGFLGAKAVATSKSEFCQIPRGSLDSLEPHSVSQSFCCGVQHIRELIYFLCSHCASMSSAFAAKVEHYEEKIWKRARADLSLGARVRKQDKKSVLASPDVTAIEPHITQVRSVDESCFWNRSCVISKNNPLKADAHDPPRWSLHHMGTMSLT